jgi:hypothetical protein
MRIDPALLFPFVVGPRLGDWVVQGYGHDGEPPHEWHFEHDGWLVGGQQVWPTEKCLKEARPLWWHRLHAAWPSRFPLSKTGNTRVVYLHREGWTAFVHSDLLFSVIKHMVRRKQSSPQTLIALLLRGKPLSFFSQRKALPQQQAWEPMDATSPWNLGHIPRRHVLNMAPAEEHADPQRWRGNGSRRQTGDLQPLYERLTAMLDGHPIAEAFPCALFLAHFQNWIQSGPQPLYRSQALAAHPLLMGGLLLEQWQPLSAHPSIHWSPQRFNPTLLNHLTERIDRGLPWQSLLCEHLLGRIPQSEDWPDAQAIAVELRRGFKRLSKPSAAAFLPADCIFPGSSPKVWAGALFVRSWNTSSNQLPFVVIWLLGVLEKQDLPQSVAQWRSCSLLLGTLMSHPLGTAAEMTHFDQRQRFRHYRTILKGLTPATHPDDWLISQEEHSVLEQWHDTHTWLTRAAHPYPLSERPWGATAWRRAHHAFHLAHRRATRRQIERLARLHGHRPHAALEVVWPACLPRQRDHGGYRFQALLNPLALTQEGDLLGHCVAGYVEPCAQGLSRIYSIVSHDDTEAATLELYQPTPGKPPAVAQLQGPRNTLPSRALQLSVAQFMAALEAWPDHRAWPCVELSTEWQRCLNERGHVEDDQFWEEIRTWISKHTS